jgi:hypothetical protein
MPSTRNFNTFDTENFAPLSIEASEVNVTYSLYINSMLPSLYRQMKTR